MTVMQTSSLTLETFLKQPETKPAREYIDEDIIQKNIPQARHSRLQGKLIYHINEVAEKSQLAYAFPELRCTFGGCSIVPDIAVLYWENIAVDDNGEPKDNILIAPNWTIEILSPEQSSNRVTNNILHCLKYGCQLGWLIDPDDRSILIFQPEKQPEFCHRNDSLLVLDGINLHLTAEQVFNWLKMKL
ncbi:MAG: Uma2 family endonuclease [Crocosphaera sp.]|nr:Uma2 family endonuclease [Crocosphaera sp.]